MNVKEAAIVIDAKVEGQLEDNMSGIKKKDLEIKLEGIPSHPDPSPDLEQYKTPSTIASDMLFRAFINKDIKGKAIADLGCGTGIFSIGAAYLGASHIYSLDIDSKAIDVARETAKEHSFTDVIDHIEKKVSDFDIEVDTVLMNPPFGSQKKGADIPFLKKSFTIAERVYTLHNAKTVDFLENYIKDKGHNLIWQKRYMFEIDNIFEFHEEKKKNFEIIGYGIDIKRE